MPNMDKATDMAETTAAADAVATTENHAAADSSAIKTYTEAELRASVDAACKARIDKHNANVVAPLQREKDEAIAREAEKDAEIARLKAEISRGEWAKEAAEKTGIPAELLTDPRLSVKDADDLADLAAKIAEQVKTKQAYSPIARDTGESKSPKSDTTSEFVASIFNRKD